MNLDTTTEEPVDLEYPEIEEILDVALEADFLMCDLLNWGKLPKKLEQRVKELRNELNELVAVHNLH